MVYYLLLLPLDNSLDTVKRHQCLFGKKYLKQGRSYEYPGLLSKIPCTMLVRGVYRLCDDTVVTDDLLSKQDELHFIIVSSLI